MRETKAWRYAIGMFGTSIPINMAVASMAVYYTEVLKVITLAQIAGVLTVYAIIDAIDNPVYGYLSDRTRTRWGRRRPWLVIGAPILAVGLIGLFSPPGSLDPAAYVAWFALFAILTETADSLVNTNYGSLLPELFPAGRRRSRVNALRQGFSIAAMIIALALTPALASVIGYPRTAIVYGAIAVVVILVMATGAREDPRRSLTVQPRLLESVKAILGVGSFWLIAVTNGLYAGATALLIVGAQYFVIYTLDLPLGNSTILIGAVLLAAAASLPFWARAATRRGPIPVWRSALLVLAVALIPFYFAGSLVVASACGILVGIGVGGFMATADLVQARFIDADAARTGEHREAMVIAAFGFFNRLNALVKAGGMLLVSVVFGFQNAKNPGDDPAGAARTLTVVLPLLLVVAAAIVARFVRIEVEPGPDDAAAAGAVPVPQRPAA